MSAEKLQGMRTLPGGLLKYVKTLTKIMEKVQSSNPTYDELVKWIDKEFNSGGTEASSRFLDTSIRVGFIIRQDDKLYLSEESKNFLESLDNKIIYNILNNAVLGFEDILSWLQKERTLNTEEILNKLNKKYNFEWKTNSQVNVRLNWLRSLGYVEKKETNFILTEKGLQLLHEENNGLKRRLDELEHAKPTASELGDKIKAAQSDTENPEKFEMLVAEAFDFLGFEATHIGGPGEPDIVLNAPIGFKSYKVIIDCKTGKEQIGEYRIDWLTLREHKVKYNANYAIVVAPGFAGGRLSERARSNELTLFDTEVLLSLLTMHEKTPLTLIDIKHIFEVSGFLHQEQLSSVKQKSEEYENFMNLLISIFGALEETSHTGEKFDVSALRVFLKYTKNVDCTEDEIEAILKILESDLLGAISRENDYLIPSLKRSVLIKKLDSLINFLNKPTIK